MRTGGGYHRFPTILETNSARRHSRGSVNLSLDVKSDLFTSNFSKIYPTYVFSNFTICFTLKEESLLLFFLIFLKIKTVLSKSVNGHVMLDLLKEDYQKLDERRLL